MNSLTPAVSSLCLLFLVGCAGSTPREYAPYYDGWESLPSPLFEDLERARRDAPRDPDNLLVYARLSGKVARHQAQIWLRLASEEEESEPVTPRVAHTRRRMLESCRQTLAVYHELRLTGRRLQWTDRVDMTWLLILGGFDAEAEDLVEGLVSDPELPRSQRKKLLKILDELRALPPEKP